MSYIGTNVAAILVATPAGLAIGAVFIGALRRFGMNTPIRSGLWFIRPLLVAFVAEFWLAAILAGALILAPPQAAPWTMAIGSAIVIWIGFVVPVFAATDSVRKVPLGTTVFDCLHWLIVMVSQAAILHVFGLVRPQ